MFAIGHAATALLIKKRYPAVPLSWLLLSVQFVEVLWVLFNLLGIERTSTEPVVDSVREIHLESMPYSHSIASSLVLAFLVWIVVGRVRKHRTAALPLAIGVLSHIVLDLLTHNRDIAIIPGLEQKMGLGLYAVPMLAFAFETAYGLVCWWVFRGGKALLAIILGFNLANLSFFSISLRGPELLMANHPLWIVGAVAVQILVTSIAVGEVGASSIETPHLQSRLGESP